MDLLWQMPSAGGFITSIRAEQALGDGDGPIWLGGKALHGHIRLHPVPALCPLQILLHSVSQLEKKIHLHICMGVGMGMGTASNMTSCRRVAATESLDHGLGA